MSAYNCCNFLRFQFILCLSILLALELTLALISFFNINEDSRNVTKSILRFELLESNKTIAHFHEIEKHVSWCCCTNHVICFVQNEVNVHFLVLLFILFAFMLKIKSVNCFLCAYFTPFSRINYFLFKPCLHLHKLHC